MPPRRTRTGHGPRAARRGAVMFCPCRALRRLLRSRWRGLVAAVQRNRRRSKGRAVALQVKQDGRCVDSCLGLPLACCGAALQVDHRARQGEKIRHKGGSFPARSATGNSNRAFRLVENASQGGSARRFSNPSGRYLPRARGSDYPRAGCSRRTQGAGWRARSARPGHRAGRIASTGQRDKLQPIGRPLGLRRSWSNHDGHVAQQAVHLAFTQAVPGGNAAESVPGDAVGGQQHHAGVSFGRGSGVLHVAYALRFFAGAIVPSRLPSSKTAR